MQRKQAYQFELRPNREQQRNMQRYSGACRYVYNRALTMQQSHHEAGKRYIGYVTMARYLTQWRNSAETPWLKLAPCHPLQHALKDLDRAYQNFFAKRAAFPRFRKKGQTQSFRFPDAKQFTIDQANSRLRLPKLGWMRYRNSREILGVPKNITVSHRGGKWFVSIQTERTVETPVPVATSSIGVDVGITRFATLSDGSVIEPLNSFHTHQQRLLRCQKNLSRKSKFSNNWKKEKQRLQKMHARIANVRQDFLHKHSSTISKNHAMVCVEDLQVSNMSRSSRGTAAKPGKRVRQKSGMNRRILDQGWGEFRRQLTYKLEWNGGWLVAVPAKYTSQSCPCCAHVSAENRKTQAAFKCVQCSYENNADLVGAMNIRERGLRLSACGEEGSGWHDSMPTKPTSMKQEPTEVTAHECIL